MQGGERMEKKAFERVDELIRRWQEQDGTPNAPSVLPIGTVSPTQALFHLWECEDAEMTLEEVEKQSQLCHEMERDFERLKLR